jgi:hypothetical protein
MGDRTKPTSVSQAPQRAVTPEEREAILEREEDDANTRGDRQADLAMASAMAIIVLIVVFKMLTSK